MVREDKGRSSSSAPNSRRPRLTKGEKSPQKHQPRKSILRKNEKLGSKHAVKFSKSTWHQIKIRERKGPSRGIIQKCEPHERSSCAPGFEERSQEETLHQESCARRVAWDLVKNICKLKNADKALFCTSIEARVMPTPTSTSPVEREFAADSGASMHMLSKKDSSSAELESSGTPQR